MIMYDVMDTSQGVVAYFVAHTWNQDNIVAEYFTKIVITVSQPNWENTNSLGWLLKTMWEDSC